MLIRLLRIYLRPYRKAIAAIVLLQLVQTLATLYLPTLNADIIDNGVVTGDTGYIVRIGGVMLGDHAWCRSPARSAPSTSAPGPRWRWAATSGRRLPPGPGVLRPRGRPVRRAVADHPDHQRRAAGPDAGADDLHADGVGPDHVRRRHHPGAAPGRAAVRRCCSSRCRCWSSSSGLIIRRMRPLFRLMQTRIDTHQPGAARADHRHPGDPGVRPRPAGARPVRRGQRRSSSTSRCGVGRLMALMFPTVMLVINLSSVAVLWFGGHRIDSGGHADRRADRVPQLPDADPDVGHDGDLHVHHDAAGRGVRRAHRGGARHRS